MNNLWWLQPGWTDEFTFGEPKAKHGEPRGRSGATEATRVEETASPPALGQEIYMIALGQANEALRISQMQLAESDAEVFALWQCAPDYPHFKERVKKKDIRKSTLDALARHRARANT